MTLRSFFISDLHLSPSDPELTNLFLKFIDFAKHEKIEDLYILGDFFQYWIGNDNIQSWHETIISALCDLAKTTKIIFMAGNRDFLVDKTTGKIFNFQVVSDDILVINLHKKTIALMHGDTLCSDDTNYQLFRAFVRNKFIKKFYLAFSLSLRKYLVQKIRNHSNDNHDSNKKNYNPKFDATQKAVEKLFKNTGASILIHGHTHQPKVHYYHQNTLARYVLGDWHKDHAYYLEIANINNNFAIELKLFN